jgi:peptidyl-prolyl cis-trans isomerase D
MLQTIRERFTGWVAIVILGLVALTLVLTFGAIDTGFTAASSAASVNGEDISLQDFRRVYQRQRQEWERNYRAQIPDVLAESMASDVLQNLVRNRVIAQYVREQGYRVNQAEVIAVIEATPAFQVGGRFSLPAYKQLLNSEGLNEARYEYEQRQDMEITQFLEGLAYTAFYTPTDFRRYVELDGETRAIEYRILQAESQANEVEISAAQIAAYYELNQSDYMSEETAAVEYVEINYADILVNTRVTVADARAYYDANPQEFIGPEEREASHILITDGDDQAAAEALAEELKGRLDSGESFAALATEYSADTGSAGNGGSLGWLGSEDTPAPEFETALFALAPGEISAPVRTQFGLHIIRLDELRSGTGKEYGEIEAELIQRLRETAAADVFADRVDELDDRSLESLEGLAPVAEAMGLKLGGVENFSRSGGEPLGLSSDLIGAVFSLEVLEDGENSPVIDLGEGRAVVVRVTDYKAAEVRPLEDVSAAILEMLRNEEIIKLVAEAGNKAVEQLNTGADRSSLNLPAGSEWLNASEVRRGAQELPPELARELFRVVKPVVGADLYHGLLLASGDFSIFKVTDYQPGTPTLYSQEQRDLRKQQLAGSLGNSQVSALMQDLVKEASVAVANDLLGTGTAPR